MTASELLDHLEEQGVELAAIGDRLRFRPQRAVDERLREELARHKHELIALLGAADDMMPTYEVAPGWSRTGWIARLHHLADVCIHPGRAAELAQWADALSN